MFQQYYYEMVLSCVCGRMVIGPQRRWLVLLRWTDRNAPILLLLSLVVAGCYNMATRCGHWSWWWMESAQFKTTTLVCSYKLKCKPPTSEESEGKERIGSRNFTSLS